MPKLTIVVPVYKPKPDYLIESVTSLIMHMPEDSEIHIGLDGPCGSGTLKSLEILREQNKRKLIRVTACPRLGLAKTLNEIISKSDCLYIARHDSDDVCLPRRFLQQLEALNLYRDTVFCGSQITRCDTYLRPYKYQRRYPISFLGQLLYSSILNNPIAHPTLMFKRHIFDRYNYRDVKNAEDWDLYVRLWQAGYRSFNLSNSTLLYRIHGSQITQGERSSQVIKRLKRESFNATIRHYRSAEILRPIIALSNGINISEALIAAKSWFDR